MHDCKNIIAIIKNASLPPVDILKIDRSYGCFQNLKNKNNRKNGLFLVRIWRTHIAQITKRRLDMLSLTKLDMFLINSNSRKMGGIWLFDYYARDAY